MAVKIDDFQMNNHDIFLIFVHTKHKLWVLHISLGDVTLNCCYDNQTGCGVQYLRCNGCRGADRIIGARVLFCSAESEFKQHQVL